ncbi:maternal effect embryo arrest [Thalictrum thalictroides]|uniref:Maternal effect embryo arrest n=1 Tax=Thalictrum thalictroides TaxID=46969 RepID=A0A7J6V332_THATH|nr:maternal effect embryo arrest [Thalictrum thalictroides]
MEALLSQFSFLSNQALHDKNFDPSTIEDLMKFFEIEAYNSWASMEADLEKEVQEAEMSMKDAEDYLDSVMESAMEEFRWFEHELDTTAKAELESLVRAGENAKMMGKSMENAATIAAKKYMEAALHSATTSMKSAWKKGLSSKTSKIHPS